MITQRRKKNMTSASKLISIFRCHFFFLFRVKKTYRTSIRSLLWKLAIDAPGSTFSSWVVKCFKAVEIIQQPVEKNILRYTPINSVMTREKLTLWVHMEANDTCENIGMSSIRTPYIHKLFVPFVIQNPNNSRHPKTEPFLHSGDPKSE